MAESNAIAIFAAHISTAAVLAGAGVSIVRARSRRWRDSAEPARRLVSAAASRPRPGGVLLAMPAALTLATTWFHVLALALPALTARRGVLDLCWELAMRHGPAQAGVGGVAAECRPAKDVVVAADTGFGVDWISCLQCKAARCDKRLILTSNSEAEGNAI